MAFASIDNHSDSAPLAEINMVPLIDVMLVLLIIFMVTAPLLTHSVKIDLPKASSLPNDTKRSSVELAINARQQIFWNGELLSHEALQQKLMISAKREPHTELHIRADKTTPYEQIAKIMSLAAKSGITRIGFITDPSE